jgi:hypothetical protein
MSRSIVNIEVARRRVAELTAQVERGDPWSTRIGLARWRVRLARLDGTHAEDLERLEKQRRATESASPEERRAIEAVFDERRAERLAEKKKRQRELLQAEEQRRAGKAAALAAAKAADRMQLTSHRCGRHHRSRSALAACEDRLELERVTLLRRQALAELGDPNAGGRRALVSEGRSARILGVSRKRLKELNLPVEIVRNPHFGVAPPMRLYDPLDLLAARQMLGRDMEGRS